MQRPSLLGLCRAAACGGEGHIIVILELPFWDNEFLFCLRIVFLAHELHEFTRILLCVIMATLQVALITLIIGVSFRITQIAEFSENIVLVKISATCKVAI